MTTAPYDAQQIAALPLHWDKKGRLRVLMVTSRDTGRWVMPKGWLMNGKKPWKAAEIEALEEAGAIGFISPDPIGVYFYNKKVDRRTKLRCRVTVYPMVVDKLKSRWKERNQRKRHWFSLREAARLVGEDDLTILLKRLAKSPESLSTVKDMRNAS